MSFNSVDRSPLTDEWWPRRQAAVDLARRGEVEIARQQLCVLAQEAGGDREQAAVLNDLAAISAVRGYKRAAERGFLRSLRRRPDSLSARQNLESLGTVTPSARDAVCRRVAILSLLLSWPSTGGGTVHTKELADALQADGFDVCHFYAVHQPWGIGAVTMPLAAPSMPLEFTADEWVLETIQSRFRDAIDEFAPDVVIVTDSWNTKPLLAEAVAGYSYFLRLAALETVCPLNNVRLLFEDGRFAQCDQNQLAAPTTCRQCVERQARYSGRLHHAERALAGFFDDHHSDRLRRAYQGAEGVLVVNPAIADLVRPYCRRVEVVPSGFDPKRFPKPDWSPSVIAQTRPTQFLFAGVVDEPFKGFDVLWTACQRLWSVRRDFELVVTSDFRTEWQAPFVRWIGWQSQADLPAIIREVDVHVFPTIAQEGLGRTAVEAMGCGKPVIASRLGGLPWVVEDGRTGWLVEPGNVLDLAERMSQLIDDPVLQQQFGRAGREKFQREFPWPAVIARHYRPLLETRNHR